MLNPVPDVAVVPPPAASATAVAPAVADPAPSRTTVHREPVVALDGRVVGYAVTVGVEPTVVPDQQDTQRRRTAPRPVSDKVLHDAYMALDLPNLVADRYVFLPATPAMLDGFIPQPVVPGRLVLDLPVDFSRRPDAAHCAAALRALGAQLALTGYQGSAADEALLPHVNFVVVTPHAGLPLPAVVHHVHRSGVRVIARDVRDQAARNECQAAGVDALRGDFGEDGASSVAPDAGGPRVLRAGELQCLAIMHLLAQPEVDMPALAQVVDTDPVLTLRVLHLVNSGAYALLHEVDTVHRAVVLLGPQQINLLVASLLLDARPDAMDSLWFILARALTCESLADDQAGYTVGMLSALAGQLNVPAEAIIEKVGVSPAVAEAVVHQSGALGSVLAAVRAHERRDVTGVVGSGLRLEDVSAVYVKAVSDALATARAVTREPGL
ncbi:EAL and HDOD domain-containing protein [Actinotalea sp. K2]|uniref:EAL and HDOD domain-containing protein n=1 Tax=Actinotalea sp. K2 TaxID=2939438 RepID=UPI002017397F|nr:HDOD domain-containing protein [Actinotalea sp. K2]MCL3860843.1 HDOD domain-containing protein [Actinotalea sp. K2]